MVEEKFYKHVFTKKGLLYLAKQQTGTLPQITRAATGSGAVPEEELENQTAITDQVAPMEMDRPHVEDPHILIIPTRITNKDIPTTVLIRQIGIYANDPDEGEILYQLVQFETPIPLPSIEANQGRIAVLDFPIDVTFANSDTVAVQTSPDYFLRRADLDEYDIEIQSQFANNVNN